MQSFAWKLDEYHLFKRIGISVGERNHDLFGAAVNTADKRNLCNDFFTQVQQFFPEDICGQYSYQQNNQKGHGETQEGDAVSFRYGSAGLDQEFRENGGEGIEILEQEFEDKESDRNGQGDQESGDKNISDAAFYFADHEGMVSIKWTGPKQKNCIWTPERRKSIILLYNHLR